MSRPIDLYTHPHAIEKVLKYRPRDLLTLALLEGEATSTYRHLIEMARLAGVRVEAYRSRSDLARALYLSSSEGQRNIVARVYRYPVHPFKEQFEQLFVRGKLKTVVLFDSIVDPHNVGALLRSAFAFGMKVVLIPERRGSPITAAVANVAVGVIEQMTILEFINLGQTLRQLKESGFVVVGTVPAGGGSFDVINADDRVAILVGSEGGGLKLSAERESDFLVTIPMMQGDVCLNASVAGAISFYEISKRMNLIGD